MMSDMLVDIADSVANGLGTLIVKFACLASLSKEKLSFSSVVLGLSTEATSTDESRGKYSHMNNFPVLKSIVPNSITKRSRRTGLL